MKTILDVMPVGAPWGGPESVRFASCFASLAMFMEKYDETAPVNCTEGPRLCTRCGKCSATRMQKKHEELHHTYLTVSGLGLHAIWRVDWLAQCLEDMTTIVADEAYVERAMAYAGYEYKDVANTPKETMQREIRGSIDMGFPVLAYRILGDDWCVIAGYSDGGETLFGRYAPKLWDSPGKMPDLSDENEMSIKSSWYSPGARVLIVTGRRQPERRFADLFHQLSGVLHQPRTKDCVSGMAGYEACITRLADDAFFQAFDEEDLKKCYFYIHAMVGALAEGRCFASFAFLSGFYGQITNATLDLAHTIGAYFMDTHNKCWGAWAAMGENHVCEPEKYAEAFRSREVRGKVAGFMEEFRKNDEMAMRLLEDTGRIEWFK